MSRLRADGKGLRKIDRARLAFRRRLDAIAIGQELSISASIGIAWLAKMIYRRNKADAFGFVSLSRDPDLGIVTLTYQTRRKKISDAN